MKISRRPILKTLSEKEIERIITRIFIETLKKNFLRAFGAHNQEGGVWVSGTTAGSAIDQYLYRMSLYKNLSTFSFENPFAKNKSRETPNRFPNIPLISRYR